jgi:cell division septation protein DedD
MKSIKSCILIAALCCMMPAFAQKNFGDAKYTSMCSYYGEQITGTITAYDADAATQDIVTKIMAVIGLKPNFELRIANVPNAAAVFIKGKRYLLYNPKFMEQIEGKSGTRWAAISILAHEIGHHLNGHTLDNVGSRPKTELEADEFSGFVLRKMGATLQEAQVVMSIIASLKGSHTHPAKGDRLAFIATGWNNAAPQATTVSASQTSEKQPDAIVPVRAKQAAAAPKAPAKPAPVAAQPKAVATTAQPKKTASRPKKAAPKQAVASSQTAKNKGVEASVNSASVLSDVYFTASPKGRYYVTAKGNLVQVEGDNVYLVASLYKSDRKGYSVMFANDSNKIYVGNGGTLVNEKGARVGYVKSR